MVAAEDSGPVLDTLRLHDRERYLTTLFVDADKRPGLWAVLAFNLELAKVREVASEDLIGRMRLQWWRDRLDEIEAGNPPQHPVALALAELAAANSLPKAGLLNLINARERDLEPEAPASLNEVAAYADATSAGLLRVMAEILGETAEMPEPLRQIGTAWGLVGLMRAIPHHAHYQRCWIPEDIRAQTGLDAGRMFDFGSQPELAAAVTPVLDHARSLVAEARAARTTVPKSLKPLCLLAVLLDRHFHAFTGAGNDPFKLPQQPPGAGTLLKLMMVKLTGRY